MRLFRYRRRDLEAAGTAPGRADDTGFGCWFGDARRGGNLIAGRVGSTSVGGETAGGGGVAEEDGHEGHRLDFKHRSRDGVDG